MLEIYALYIISSLIFTQPSEINTVTCFHYTNDAGLKRLTNSPKVILTVSVHPQIERPLAWLQRPLMSKIIYIRYDYDSLQFLQTYYRIAYEFPYYLAQYLLSRQSIFVGWIFTSYFQEVFSLPIWCISVACRKQSFI